MKILVIEDETQIREEVSDWLQFEGYETVTAANGRLGLAAVEQENPDLIMCDVTMPQMDGYEVLIEVRANQKHATTPFIFLTAAADRDSLRKGMSLGADDYLTKPFTLEEVLGAIRTRLQRRAAQTQQGQHDLEILNSALNQEREQHLLKSRLIALFSHDFRNPLATILMSSSVVRNYADRLPPARKQQALNRIDGAVHSLTQMLDDMLIIAELESGYLAYKPEPTALAPFIEAIIAEYRLIDQNAHKLTFHCGLCSPTAVDPKLLRQLLSNVIANALNYSPAGSEVTITVTEGVDTFTLSIQDQGIGIPAESLPYLFEPLYRADNAKQVRGTGLGLSIVKNCVDRHRGSITVISELNRGTNVCIELPLTAN